MKSRCFTCKLFDIWHWAERTQVANINTYTSFWGMKKRNRPDSWSLSKAVWDLRETFDDKYSFWPLGLICVFAALRSAAMDTRYPHLTRDQYNPSPIDKPVINLNIKRVSYSLRAPSSNEAQPKEQIDEI